MTNYIFVNKDNGKINGCGQCKRIDDNIFSCEVTEEIYEDFRSDNLKYIAVEREEEIDVPDYDEEGNPIIIEYEDTETVIDYDEEGNPIGSHEITVIKHKQSTHKETIIVYDIIPNPNYEEEHEEQERKRLDMLSLTKREVFLALYKDKGITPEQLKVQITNAEALIEFEYANDYFRGNPLINQIGQMLGYTTDDLDYLFEHKELPAHES